MPALRYESVPGFFMHDTPSKSIGPVPERFGLLDASPDRWATFISRLRELNATGAADAASYKLIVFGRHGQGYHNVAEDKYGNQAWKDHWAMLDGDGELTWGPDPELTDLGKEQAAAAHALWDTELAAGMPLPQLMFCSPMTRAIQTNQITFEGLAAPMPLIIENCREEYGEHTCHKRRTASYLRATFPSFDVEDGFTEEDELWTADTHETEAHEDVRARNVLDRIFGKDNEDALMVSVTAHGAIINAFDRVVGRPQSFLSTGGVLPMVVKATRMSALPS